MTHGPLDLSRPVSSCGVAVVSRPSARGVQLTLSAGRPQVRVPAGLRGIGSAKSAELDLFQIVSPPRSLKARGVAASGPPSVPVIAGSAPAGQPSGRWVTAAVAPAALSNYSDHARHPVSPSRVIPAYPTGAGFGCTSK
jgi:hypothetical protein